MHRCRATFLPAVPTLLIALSEHKNVRRYDLTSLRACISGGATLTRKVKERFEALTGGRVVEGYGLSEAWPVTHANPIYTGAHAGSIGLPWPEVDCKVVDPEDPSLEVPLGEIGELVVRGAQVMKGYWNNPEETAKAVCREPSAIPSSASHAPRDSSTTSQPQKLAPCYASRCASLRSHVSSISVSPSTPSRCTRKRVWLVRLFLVR